ncbi:unnamed protein product [Echinostoma caproni]|uniref:S ribonuclease n=1 Tax=Echinostoma caproni TaxID=27848 RepID=A0A183AZ60_9TREM|nr:unnamed protein product [Echinostoma caproni]
MSLNKETKQIEQVSRTVAKSLIFCIEHCSIRKLIGGYSNQDDFEVTRQGSVGMARMTGSLDRAKMPPQFIEKVKTPNPRLKKTHEASRGNTGVIGSKHLQSIYNIVEETKQRVPGNGKDNKEDASRVKLQDRVLTKSEDAVINSVMQQVAELNREKLSDDSMVKVLTAVYLDAKSKLAERNRPEPTVNTDITPDASVPQSGTDLSKSNGGTENQSHNMNAKSASPNQPQSIAERKRIQWEKEKGLKPRSVGSGLQTLAPELHGRRLLPCANGSISLEYQAWINPLNNRMG